MSAEASRHAHMHKLKSEYVGYIFPSVERNISCLTFLPLKTSSAMVFFLITICWKLDKVL